MLSSFIRLLTRCYRLALPYGRLKLFTVLGLILFNGMLQLIGVTSIFPFFALAAEPDRLRKSNIGSYLLHFLPPISTNHLLVLAGCFSILMLVIASLGSIASEVIRIRYAYGFCHWLRRRLFESYAQRPYGFFLRRNTADLNQKLWDIMTFIQNVLLPIGEIVTRVVLVILLVGTVFLVQPWVAIGAIIVLGGFYLIVFVWLRPRTRLIASDLQIHNTGFVKNTLQFLQGIKTVMVHERSHYFMDKALSHSGEIGRAQSMIPIYSNGPRYMIEPVAFGGLVAIVIILALQGRSFSDILPNLSVMALAAMRLLPTLQILYSQLVTVASNNYTLTQLEEEILQLERETEGSVHERSPVGSLTFEREIKLDALTFYCPNPESPIISDFSLTISKNESIGIVGPSGSGKSTLVDLLLGLHTAQEGRILIDRQPLDAANMISWRRMIGYVPQDIYLLDETIEANIAFGIPPEEIDREAVRRAAEGAQILDFIERELPEGFSTTIGERGVRLSGGQRQRIGLARALYHKPRILILDEATSALDNATEKAVMETIHRLQGTLTIITIAHRLSTLEKCDRIINLNKVS
jgi:ABC-type multidrug transport system fused ATPase/permease subunit